MNKNQQSFHQPDSLFGANNLQLPFTSRLKNESPYPASALYLPPPSWCVWCLLLFSISTNWLVVECVVYCRRLQGSGGWWTLLLYLGVVSKLHTLNGLVGEFSCCSEQIVANWVIIMWKAHQVPLRGFNESTVSLNDKSYPVMQRGLRLWGSELTGTP